MTRPISESIPISTTEKSKRDRELYVTNLPNSINSSSIVKLLNTALISIEANTHRGDPILSAWTSPDKEYSLLLFRSVEECNNAFKLNGMNLLNKSLRIGKPIYSDESDSKQTRDMFPTLSSFEKDLNNKMMSNSSLNSNFLSSSNSTKVSSSSNNAPATSKLQISNIPLNLGENNIKEIFKLFGKIKSIEMLKDQNTNKFNGQCNLEYETEKATQDALHYAMGINLQNNILYIKRISSTPVGYNIPSSSHNIGNNALGILGNSYNSLNPIRGGTIPSLLTNDYIKMRENNASKVICIKNAATMQEVSDNKEYDAFYDEVLEECKVYGKVIQIKIPRPNGEFGGNGIGKVFVEYANRDGAAWAKKHLNGTSFRGRNVEVVFHPEESFKKNQFE